MFLAQVHWEMWHRPSRWRAMTRTSDAFQLFNPQLQQNCDWTNGEKVVDTRFSILSKRCCTLWVYTSGCKTATNVIQTCITCKPNKTILVKMCTRGGLDTLVSDKSRVRSVSESYMVCVYRVNTLNWVISINIYMHTHIHFRDIIMTSVDKSKTHIIVNCENSWLLSIGLTSLIRLCLMSTIIAYMPTFRLRPNVILF